MLLRLLGPVVALVAAGLGLYFMNANREIPMSDNMPAFENTANAAEPRPDAGTTTETATFGSGCFWCTEAVFLRIKGVQKVVSGYMGGKVKNPTYEQVCSGLTGHAEVIQITYDPAVISFPELLEVFWKTHDPTTLNRQGNDVGTQYRSAIFYHTPKQKELAESYKKKIEDAKVFNSPIVTEITPAVEFYPAEAYHQNYFALNSRQGYCQVVIQPKIDKLEKVFKDKLKSR